MFEGCTIKYHKDNRTNKNSCVMVTYPADENGMIDLDLGDLEMSPDEEAALSLLIRGTSN